MFEESSNYWINMNNSSKTKREKNKELKEKRRKVFIRKIKRKLNIYIQVLK